MSDNQDSSTAVSQAETSNQNIQLDSESLVKPVSAIFVYFLPYTFQFILTRIVLDRNSKQEWEPFKRQVICFRSRIKPSDCIQIPFSKHRCS